MHTNANTSLAAVLVSLQHRESLVTDIQRTLTAFRAVGPQNAGPGEARKAAWIEEFLRGCGVTDIVHVDAPDPQAEGGLRPNLVATIPGTSTRALCLFAHMDVVPEGELSLWETDPWDVVQKGDLLYGRGVEDNQQALTSMLLLAKVLHETQTTPALTIRLVFISDEECGNTLGMAWLLDKRADLFPKDDLYIVPDSGSPSGTLMEVAEKSVFRFKCTVRGRQCHASTPGKGVNSLTVMARIITALDALHTAFPQENPLFDPPCSTFTPTKHEANVEGTNILPGQDVFWVDCRAIPGVEPEAVFAKAEEIITTVASRYGATASLERGYVIAASETAADAAVVMALTRALAAEGIAAESIGIGGSTVACLLRHRGLSACAWSTILNTCHEPNEHSSISATVRDAAVFARIALEEDAVQQGEQTGKEAGAQPGEQQ